MIATLALNAARLGLDHKLPIIFATVQGRKSVILTQDEDFKGIKGIKYIEKKKK